MKCYGCPDKKKHVWAGISKEDVKEEAALVFSLDGEVRYVRRELLIKGGGNCTWTFRQVRLTKHMEGPISSHVNGRTLINPYSWTLFCPLCWNVLKWKPIQTRLNEDLIWISLWENQRVISQVAEKHVILMINVFLNTKCLSKVFLRTGVVVTAPLTKTKSQRLCPLHCE